MEALIEHFVYQLPYLGVVLILLASGFGLPVPEDIPLLIGGYCCGKGLADIEIMLPVAFLAVLGGDSVVYCLGRRYGHHVQRLPLLNRYLTPSRLQKAEQAFHAHGGKTLFMARFMPGLRAPVYFSAGAFKIPFWKMLAFDGSAAVLSVPIWVIAAWYIGYSTDIDWTTLKQWSTGVQVGMFVLVFLAVATLLSWKLVRRRRLASAG